MSAYLIAQHHVSDRAGFEEWRSKVMPIIEQNGGRFVVRSDNVDVLEGDLKVTNIAIIEFADRATLNRAREQLKGHAEGRRRAARSVVLAAE
jgi:uncharacterized protein (DUF1330 family)